MVKEGRVSEKSNSMVQLMCIKIGDTIIRVPAAEVDNFRKLEKISREHKKTSKGVGAPGSFRWREDGGLTLVPSSIHGETTRLIAEKCLGKGYEGPKPAMVLKNVKNSR